MTDLQTIFLFRYSDSALYALTKDESGTSLPTRMFPEEWRKEETMTLDLRKPRAQRELIKVTLETIETHGFYLMYAANQKTPLAKFA